MSTQHTHGDDQLLRRAFDALYDFDIQNVIHAFDRLDRRTRWYLFSAVGVLMLVLVVTQLGKGISTAIHNANLPTAYETLQAPYNLGDNLIQLDTAALPTLGDFTQTPVELANINPEIACMADINTCTEAQLANWADLASGISASYSNETQTFSLTALNFGDQTTAQRALVTLYDYADANGAMGNYVIMASQPVRYYYGLANGWLNFTWAANNSIYTLNVRNARELESVIELLRTAPVVVTEGVTSG